jgi:hypothetical protein
MKNKKNALNESDLSADRYTLIKPTKNMKKVTYALILLLVVVSGLVFANREIKKDKASTRGINRNCNRNELPSGSAVVCRY